MNLLKRLDYYEIRKVYSYRQGKTVNRLIVSLPGSGCKYYKNGGGCSMCGFHLETNKYSLGILYPAIVFKKLFDNALKAGLSLGASEVYVFNGGSFLNDKEIPASFQLYLFTRLSKIESVKALLIESRCEYISEDKLKRIKPLIINYDLVIAIGLESQNDYIRNKIIRKGLSKNVFEKTVKRINSFGFVSAAYVFLKPIGITEKEALLETIKSINYSISAGCRDVILSSAFVQKGTIMEREYLSKRFRPPYLWTIVEIIKKSIYYSWPLSVGEFNDKPSPLAIPKNCDQCSCDIYRIIDKYRETAILDKISRCSCYASYINAIY